MCNRDLAGQNPRQAQLQFATAEASKQRMLNPSRRPVERRPRFPIPSTTARFWWRRARTSPSDRHSRVGIGASTSATASRPAWPACWPPSGRIDGLSDHVDAGLNLVEGADRDWVSSVRIGARYPSRAGANMQFRRDTGWAKRTIMRMRAPIIASAMTSRAFVQSMVQFAQVLPIIPGFAPNWRNIAHSPGPPRPGQHPQGILPNAITCSRNNP